MAEVTAFTHPGAFSAKQTDITTRGVPASGVGGTANAVTLSLAFGPALADGLVLVFRPTAANTGGVTIDYNGGGAVELLDSEGAALIDSAFATTAPVAILYDGSAAKWRRLDGGGGFKPIQSTYADLADAGSDINSGARVDMRTTAYDEIKRLYHWCADVAGPDHDASGWRPFGDATGQADIIPS